MFKHVTMMVVALVLAVGMVSAALAKGNNAAICHYDGTTGTYSLLMVSNNRKTLALHVAHGDAFPGESVPGSQPPAETVFAVAWTDVINNDVYDPAQLRFDAACAQVYSGDVLISKLIDGNGDALLGAGDQVVPGFYPTNMGLMPPFTFGAFTSSPRQVAGVVTTQNGSLVVVDTAGIQYLWSQLSGREQYSVSSLAGETCNIFDNYAYQNQGDGVTFLQNFGALCTDRVLSLSVTGPGSTTEDAFINVAITLP